MNAVQVVLFKRDLRVHDHQPLREAARRGPLLPLVVVEPGLWAQPDASGRQWAFFAESLRELQRELSQLGAPLLLRVGEMVPVFSALAEQVTLAALWSHEETGNGWTYARDRALAAWCRERGIPWHELPQNGVVRRLASREGWARRWEERLGKEPLPAPHRLLDARALSLAPLPQGALPTADELALQPDPCPGRQSGGRQAGLELLNSFLAERGRGYVKGLSSPLTAGHCCSRLSAHLAFGTLSLREVVWASRRRGGPKAFEERLHWHCHFMQKLESEPELEFREAHGAYAGLRQSDGERLAAWSAGRTGLPFVDACMRALTAEGWINFRMRALLMAVASYHLWLHWRDSGLVLARRFVDYEPGIHWNQCQMQAGTTGINIVRIYNPVKQGLDHDPAGAYVRRWVPELAAVPLAHLHTPWTMTPSEQQAAGCVLGVHYPAPVVDHLQAARQARERVWGVRQGPGFGERAAAIQERHGSRRSGLATPRGDRGRRPKGRRQSPGQLDLFASHSGLAGGCLG
ncbi:MAG: deoxyribodipyrimidine photo-lyase [Cyanobacteriota bacterium]|nr:deoxyribodipyrimidine photo-lyase [Cyanobacteriota bacterium]